MNKRVKKLLFAILFCCLAVPGGMYGATEFFGEGFGEWMIGYQPGRVTQSGGMASSSVTEGEMQVIFLDVGQGDCTVVRTKKADMVIDCGDKGSADEVVEYLRSQGIHELEYLILTHPDSDHIGGADEVLAAFEVERVLMPDVGNDTKAYAEVLKQIEENEVVVEHPDVGDSYLLGDAMFWILCPDPELVRESDLNGSSVGIKLVHGENSFVMCGDAEEESEQAMVERFGNALECDVLKCGHHGSSTATSAEFLKVTDPTWAVISCGKDNPYGHPHAEVMAALEDDDVQVYRTDCQGTVIAISNGKELKWRGLQFDGSSLF